MLTLLGTTSALLGLLCLSSSLRHFVWSETRKESAIRSRRGQVATEDDNDASQSVVRQEVNVTMFELVSRAARRQKESFGD